MNKRTYKTAQGTQLDIDQLRLLNESVVAVGNMRVNARGDEVNSDGSIKTPKGEIMRSQYRMNTTQVKDLPVAPTPRYAVSRDDAPVTPVVNPPTELPAETKQLRGSLASSIATTSTPDDLQAPALTTTTTTTKTIKRI